MVVRTMSTSVNEERTCTTDTLTAVVVERNRTAALASPLDSNRVCTFSDKLLVENVKHLKERSVLFDAGNLVGLEMTLFLGVLLTPYLKIEIHTRLVFIISGFNLNEFVFERLLVILRLCILALVFPS